MRRHFVPITLGLVLLLLFLLSGASGGALAQLDPSSGRTPSGASAQPDNSAQPSGVRLQAVSAQISYQGHLTDSGGTPLHGSHDISVELWDDPDDGDMLWDQDFMDEMIWDGLLDLKLDVDPEDFDGQALWLAIAVDGEDLSPRQEILPAPYALSLRPGAEIDGDDDFGFTSRTSGLYGVYGVSSSDGHGAGVSGYNDGGVGVGVGGLSNGFAATYGRGQGSETYGGFFRSDYYRGMYARGATDYDPDIVLGGTDEEDDGLISSELDYPGSDLVLLANDLVAIVLDENNDEESALIVINGDDDVVFSVDEYGTTDVHGDLYVHGDIHGRGQTMVQYDLDTEGTWAIPVPEFCIDGMCQMFVFTDGTMGAFGPGLLWPVQYLQRSNDDAWLGGPNISIAGVSHSSGMGLNGNGVAEYVYLGGQTTSGGYVSVLDDSQIENEPDEWTIEFYPEDDLTTGIIYIMPMGTPLVPDAGGE